MDKKALDILSRLLKESAITKEEYLILLSEICKSNSSELGINEFGFNYVYGDEPPTKNENVERLQKKTLFDFEIGNVDGKEIPNTYQQPTN